MVIHSVKRSRSLQTSKRTGVLKLVYPAIPKFLDAVFVQRRGPCAQFSSGIFPEVISRDLSQISLPNSNGIFYGASPRGLIISMRSIPDGITSTPSGDRPVSKISCQ